MKFCIIGLGNFGTYLARHLARDGHEVMAVDNDVTHVEAMSEELDLVITADCVDINVFEDIPIADCDAVIVAIGKNFEASLSIVANLQQVGSRKIICRVINSLHARLLKLLKIEDLIIPESMAAAWLTRSLRSPGLLDSLSIGKNHEIAEIIIPKGLIGKSLLEVDLRGKYELNVVTILKGKKMLSSNSTPQFEEVLGIPHPERAFEATDLLVVFGHENNVRNFIQDYSH